MYPDGGVGKAVFGNDAESAPNERPPPGMIGPEALHLARFRRRASGGYLCATTSRDSVESLYKSCASMTPTSSNYAGLSVLWESEEGLVICRAQRLDLNKKA